jgi:hypothetical protein
MNEADELKEAVERMYGGSAAFVQSVPVRETFEATRPGKAWCTHSTW